MPDPQTPDVSQQPAVADPGGAPLYQPQPPDPATAPVPTDPNYAEATSGVTGQLPPGQDPAAIPPPGIPASPPPTPGEWQSIRDAAQGLGVDLSSYDNDSEALRHLVDRTRDFDRQAALIQQYEGLLASQQQQTGEQFTGQLPAGQQAPGIGVPPGQQQQAPPQDPQFWQPPVQFDQRMMQLVQFDEQGNVTPGPGGNPLIAQQVQQFMNWRQGEMEKFWTDGPQKYMDPYLDHRFEGYQEQVRDLVRQEMGGYRAENSVQQFVGENQWVYQHDASNNLVRNTITGRPEYSVEGQRFIQYCNQAAQWGAPFEAQRDFAVQQINAERVTSGQTSPQAQGDQQKATFLRQSAGFQPNAQGMQPTPGASVPDQPLPEGMSVEDALRNNLAAEGITDKDIAGI